MTLNLWPGRVPGPRHVRAPSRGGRGPRGLPRGRGGAPPAGGARHRPRGHRAEDFERPQPPQVFFLVFFSVFFLCFFSVFFLCLFSMFFFLCFTLARLPFKKSLI